MAYLIWKSIKIRKFLFMLVCLAFSGLSATAHAVFINEIHYDNTNADSGEAIELAGVAGTDLTGWSLWRYNGSNGAEYGKIDLAGVIPDLQDGFGVLDFAYVGLQNGAPDGLALVDNSNSLIQFLSYEGSFSATDGPAIGVISTDIGVAEEASTPVGYSLQLIGTGSVYEDFSWNLASLNSFADINAGQTFLSADTGQPRVSVPEPSSGLLLAPILLMWLATRIYKPFNRNRWRPAQSVAAPV